MSRGINFSAEIEIFYTYPSQDTTSRHSSGVSPDYEIHRNPTTPYPTSTELYLSSPSTSTDSFLLGNSSYPSDVGHVYLNPSSPTQYMQTSSSRTGRYKQEAFSPVSHPSVTLYDVTGTASAHIEHSTPGRELSEKHLKYYDTTGLHIALSSKLDLLDYDISESPENGNSIAETEAVSPYLDKPATGDYSKRVGIQHPALPVIIWIRVANDYITVSNVLHGMYDFMMTPSPDEWLDSETAERQFYIKGARDTRIRKSGDEDRKIKWIDWMPKNRRVICFSKDPQCRKDTWTIIFEDDPWNLNSSFTSRL